MHFKNDIATHYSEGDGFIGGNVTSLFEDSRGGVWIGTNRGVSHFDGQRFASSTFHDDPGIPIVNAIAEDTNGDIWLGMPGGVAIYDQEPMREHDGQDIPDTDTTTLTGHISSLSTMDGLPSNEVNALLGVADGAVWVATQLGVCRLRDDDVEQFSVPKKIVCFLKDDSGGLWAGGDGLYHFDGTRWKQISIDGKALVTGLTQDPTGRLWMATDMGLKVYDGFAVQTLLHFDGENGWCSDVSWDNRNHCVHLTSGLLKTYHPRATPSPIAITHVSADKQYESIGDVRFGSSQPFLRFAFHGTSFKTRADAMLYRYRLRGFNDEWKLTKNTQATYGRLPPGDYTFEVTAIDRDLSHSESPAIVQVHVDREYRQAAMWFGLVCGVITSVFLAMTVIKRNRGIRQLNVELDQRVKDRTSKLETETAENKKRHEQLLQTQKLDAVGTMASGIAHDFNNSLAAIMGFAELAKANPSGSDEFIEYILTASRNAAGTAKSLLTFSQNSTEEKVPQDIIRLVRDSSDFLRKILPTSIKLSSALQDSTTTWCSIDTVQIQQVLLNIAMNARDALPDGGEISISADEHPTRKDFVRLAIADNGTGMPDEVLKRIFDPFFMTKSRGQGTGLGMAIVHGIVEDHGGTIEIESSAGTGTTVSIVLPRCHPVESESEPVEPPEPVVEGRGETILVAEDNPEVQAMIETQLRSAGFDVLTADDGQQALNLLRTHAAKVRLALLDIDLPEIDGLTCLKQIALQYPRVSAIMMSGLSSVEPTQLDTPFLRKPFDRKQLLSMINGALPTGTATQANGVLVVDDNDIVRRTTEALLTSYDFDVYLANSGAEAVSQLRENLDLISTVWLDWNMPQSDPTSILKELRRISPTVRVLVVSGDLSLHAHDIQAKGFSRLLRKPF
ncbi:MAG TPA: response regulator, partial [Planctomycetes bacterium]|nr:response regulator [Planctomycetota bacterium]